MSTQIQQIQVGPMANFCYLVSCETSRKAVVVDPSAEAEKILSIVAAQKLELVAIVNTHGHIDHIAGNAAIVAATRIPIIAHVDADLSCTDPISRQILPYLAGEPSPQPERRVHDGELIEFGQAALKVIHCPGHTPGDIALYTQGAVITGDVLFVDAVGRTDLPGSSLQTLEHSLRYKLATLPDDTIVYPGHDYGHAVTSTIGAEKQHNPFMRAALKD